MFQLAVVMSAILLSVGLTNQPAAASFLSCDSHSVGTPCCRVLLQFSIGMTTYLKASERNAQELHVSAFKMLLVLAALYWFKHNPQHLLSLTAPTPSYVCSPPYRVTACWACQGLCIYFTLRCATSSGVEAMFRLCACFEHHS